MIWSLQVLRFIAAMMVVYLHSALAAFKATGSSGFIPPEIQVAGVAGVDIFFVISGVIIARTAPGLSWRQFAWKRCTRILPMYFLASMAAAAIAARSSIGWREVVASITLWPALDVMTVPLLPIAWTLSFEMTFYAAATLVLIDRRLLPVILGLFALTLALRPTGPVLQFLGNPIILEFIIGVGLAYAPSLRLGVWGIPVGAVAILIAGPLGLSPYGTNVNTIDFLVGNHAFERVVAYGIPAAMIVYGTMQVKAEKSVWTYLGDSSYTLYVFHTLAISAALALWNVYPMPPDFMILTSVVASVLLSWRIYERFEKPILAALRRASATSRVAAGKDVTAR